MLGGVLHAVENAIQKNVEGKLPLGGGGRFERADSADDARVVEHDVDAAEVFDSGVYQRLDLLLLRHVTVTKDRVGAKGLGEGLPGLVLNIAQHHLGSVLDEQLSRGGADTTGATGDNGDAVL